MILALGSALSVAALPAVALAGDVDLPEAGKSKRVVCLADPDQDYQLSLPPGYRKGTPAPILYCFDANANGRGFVNRYQPLVEKHGWIVAASLQARNGPSEPIKAAIDAILRDTEWRLSLHGKKRFGTGFSGGARMSSWLIYDNATKSQGLICLGALFAPGVKPQPKMPIAVLVGDSDPNLREMQAIQKRLKDFDAPQLYKSFPGGHVIAPAALLQEAVDWHETHWNSRFVGDSETAIAARTAVVVARVKLAEEQHAGKPAHLWRELTAIREGLPKWEGVDALKKRCKTLEKDSLVKAEKKARKKLLAYLHQEHALGKGAKQLAGLYKKLAEKNDGTPSAAVATARLNALGGQRR
jgi:dienelactone hydrolase